MARLFLFIWALVAVAAPLSSEAQSLRISNLSDLTLGTWSGSGDLSSEDAVCIYNLGSSTYQIRATGSGAGNAFTLTSSGGSLPYQTFFKGSSGSYIELTSGSSASFDGANTIATNCVGLTNASFKVVATAEALSGVSAGSYSGTLTLLLQPG